jgi:hypothetical protein
MWSATVLEPAFPRRSWKASGSPVPSGPWSTNAHSGWKPKPRLNVGAAHSFSECAVGGVHVDHQRPERIGVVVGGMLTGQRPGPRPRHRTGAGDRCQRCRGVAGQGVDQPGDCRIGGDRAEHLRCRAQLRQIGQAVPADRQADGQIQQHLARIVPGGRPPPRRHLGREGGGQTDGLRSPQQQDGPGVRHDTRALPVDCQGRIRPATLLHQKGAPVLALIRS